HDTEWLEKNVSEIIKILEIDSLLTIPVSLPFMKAGMPLSEEELLRVLKIVSKNKEGDFGNVDPSAIMKGENVIDEYNVLLDEDKKTENKGLMPEAIGIQIPSTRNVDETAIYDMSLINGLKTKFKEWKTGWKEQHLSSGDEFDEESYIEGNEPFFTDIKKSIKTKIVILLDHSSSISSDAIEYKKATLALCEVLAYLKVKFAVYAFSTENRSVVCWSIKPDNMKWNNVTAKRLAQIVANGSTPLAEVYDKMFPVLQSKRPDIFLTLTDGEPSDPDAVRNMTKLLKGLGISMVALGLGPNTVRATTIANNLRHLGYEKTMAVSRLRDIPNKVIKILDI
ncbi:von Willebrand factor type A protein, partial [Marine Group I thaumarchaeote SCGC RSA3]